MAQDMISVDEDNTDRFSGRIESYAKHRRGYPPEALTTAAQYFKIPDDAHLLDLGSGTGLLTSLLLSQFSSAQVTAAEPNKEMREFSLSVPSLAQALQSSRLRIVDGRAEATTLPDHSVDAVFVAAAFHWFDGPKARTEVMRIGRRTSNAEGQSGIPIVILTGSSIGSASQPEPGTSKSEIDDPRWGPDQHWRGFHDALIRCRQEFGIDYTARVQEVKFSPQYLMDFFGHGQWNVLTNDQSREMNLEEFLEGLESYSSVPRKGTPGYDRIVEEIKKLFAEWARDGKVKVVRDGVMYYGYVQ